MSWLGRHGAKAVAATIAIGIAAPPIGAFFKPYVIAAVFPLLCIAFLRLDGAALRDHLRRPAVVLAATAWTSLALPALMCTLYSGLGVSERSPDLYVGLVLQALAPPLMAAPALAALIGLDATLVLCTMVLSTVLLPLTAPLFAYAFLSGVLPMSPQTLGLQLTLLLGISAVCGLLIRRIAGAEAIERQRRPIDGINVIVMFAFVSAMMEGVVAHFIAQPLLTLGLLALSFIIAFAVLLLTFVLFSRSGQHRALTLGFVVAQRNTGLLLAAAAGALSDLTWLYLGFTYFPLYLLPVLLQPLVRANTNQGTKSSR